MTVQHVNSAINLPPCHPEVTEARPGSMICDAANLSTTAEALTK